MATNHTSHPASVYCWDCGAEDVNDGVGAEDVNDGVGDRQGVIMNTLIMTPVIRGHASYPAVVTEETRTTEAVRTILSEMGAIGHSGATVCVKVSDEISMVFTLTEQ